MSTTDPKKKRWTVLELLNWTTQYLEEKEFENSRLNVEMMLAHVLGFKRVDLYLNFDRPLTPEELANFKILLKRRTAHEPLQYVLGEAEFMGLPFKVRPGVLVPRPETELLVDKVLELTGQFDHPCSVLDVGTGSGNIPLSLASMAPDLTIVTTDISQDAIVIAKENAELLGVADRVTFLHHDALKPWPMEYNLYFDVIVSNPPYVSRTEFDNLPLEIKHFEPEIALLAGEEGLDFYKQFLEISKSLLKENGTLFFEIGETQANVLIDLYSSHGFSECHVHKDLADKDRIIELKK